MVRNEADIIESFVRHNLRLLDDLVIVDDSSIDGTREILNSLEREGLNIIVLDKDGPLYTQSSTISELLHVVSSRSDVDWLFPLDADEFLSCASRQALEAAIGKIGVGQVGLIPWRSYVPTSHDDLSEPNPIRRITHCRIRECPQRFKVCVPVRNPSWRPYVISLGSHRARLAVSSRKLPTTVLENVALAHFAVRGPEQIFAKVVTGWLAHIAEQRANAHENFHWREMYEHFLEKGIPTRQELERFAAGYASTSKNIDLVKTPLPSTDGANLKYTTERVAPLLSKIIRTAEHLVGQNEPKACRIGNSEMVSRRTAWQWSRMPFGERLGVGESAVHDYLENRFGAPVELLVENSVAQLQAEEAKSRSRESSLPIVIVAERNSNGRLTIEHWSAEGWAVDHTATLAVRLLARAGVLRRRAVVLNRKDRNVDKNHLSDLFASPSVGDGGESLRRLVLRWNFFYMKWYRALRASVRAVLGR